MSKELLAVDVDEVLYPFTDSFLSYHNQLYGTSAVLSQVKDYNLEEVLSLSTATIVERLHAYHSEDDLHVQAIDASVESVQALAEEYDLVVLTARSPQFQPRTIEWVTKHFGDIFQEFYHVGHPNGIEFARSKSEVCQEIGALALIDDSIDNLRNCAHSGIGAVLFGEYPWSRADQLPNGVAHKKDWPTVLEHFGVQ